MDKKIPIIIDTDPGIDDAVAIAIALNSEELDVRLITTVAGNVDIKKTTNNALKLVNFFGSNIKVAAGASGPLLKEAVIAPEIHGESGMDGYDFKEIDYTNLLAEPAIVAMYREIMATEGITLVPIGPLTNIALLFKVYPDVVKRIKGIVLMGGSTSRGNKGVLSEYNIYSDPEAARIVFQSGVKMTMCGLDVGLKALVMPEDSKRIQALNETGNMIYSLFQHYRSFGVKNGLKMYDSCAIAYLVKPSLFQTVDTYVEVETKGELTSGCTVVDLKNYLKKEPNCTVTLDIDSEQFREWIVSAIGNCK